MNEREIRFEWMDGPRCEQLFTDLKHQVVRVLFRDVKHAREIEAARHVPAFVVPVLNRIGWPKAPSLPAPVEQAEFRGAVERLLVNPGSAEAIGALDTLGFDVYRAIPKPEQPKVLDHWEALTK